MKYNELYNDAVALLRELIRTPSFSREEDATADIIANWLADKGLNGVMRHGNNVWIKNLHFDPAKPTILLCSHHDTVRPSEAWTRDPFDPAIVEAGETGKGGEAGKAGTTTEEGSNRAARLYGLGSNDAGASVVSMAAAFRHFYGRNSLQYNLILALVGEEEISGPGGVRSILPDLGLGFSPGFGPANQANQVNPANPVNLASAMTAENNPVTEDNMAAKHNLSTANNPVAENNPGEADCTKTYKVAAPDSLNYADFAIVGEPTGMNLAVAERGLMVLDCTAKGRAGHAARDEGDNAIYHAIKDMEWFRDYRFPLKSPLFGEVKMSVTMISAGVGHNVVPAECRFVVDCRVTERYTNEEVLGIVRQHVACDVVPRSLHLRSSSIELEHPVVQAGISLGLSTFGSPTTSDQVALTTIPSVKIGPGQSARSHSADEYIELSEIEQGITLYIKLLEKIIS